MRNRLMVIIISLVHLVEAQNIPLLSQQHNSLGGAELSSASVWHYRNNMADLAQLKATTLALSYAQPYLIKELNLQSFVAAVPFRTGVFAFSFEHFGLRDMSEIQWALSYAKALAPYLSIGLKFSYYQVYQPEYYGNLSKVLGELSLSGRINEKLQLSAYLYNASFRRISEYYQWPVFYHLSASYFIEEAIVLNLRVSKRMDYRASYSAMIDFRLSPNLFVKTGIGIQPYHYFLGLTYRVKQMEYHILFTYQQNLGLIPYSHYSYAFKK